MDDAVGVRVIEGGGQHLGDVQCVGNRQQLLAEQVLLQIGRCFLIFLMLVRATCQLAD